MAREAGGGIAELSTNFATSLVATAPSPATSGTSLVVTAGEGARFPNPATTNFNAIVCPADAQPTPNNAEIVRVTAKSTDTFTITRAQESTTARSIIVGDRIYAGVTAKTLADIDVDLFNVAANAIGKVIVDAKGDLIAATAADAPARLAVGANNQVLRADSGATAGVSWTSNFDRDQGLPGMFAPLVGVYGVSAQALTASRAYFNRFVPSRNMTVTLIGFNVTTASGSDDACDAGIYTFSGSTLTRVASAGATTGKLNALGPKTLSVSASLTAGTVYYAGFSVGTFGGTAGQLMMASAAGNGGFDVFGTALGSTISCFKASSHPLGTPVSSLSTNASTTPLLAIRES